MSRLFFLKPGRMKIARQFTRPASLNFNGLTARTFFVHTVVLALHQLLSSGFANNNVAHQPSCLHSLISNFVIGFWKALYTKIFQTEFHFSS